MTHKPVTITVDSRETRSAMADRLRRIPAVTVLQAELECAEPREMANPAKQA